MTVVANDRQNLQVAGLNSSRSSQPLGDDFSGLSLSGRNDAVSQKSVREAHDALSQVQSEVYWSRPGFTFSSFANRLQRCVQSCQTLVDLNERAVENAEQISTLAAMEADTQGIAFLAAHLIAGVAMINGVGPVAGTVILGGILFGSCIVFRAVQFNKNLGRWFIGIQSDWTRTRVENHSARLSTSDGDALQFESDCHVDEPLIAALQVVSPIQANSREIIEAIRAEQTEGRAHHNLSEKIAALSAISRFLTSATPGDLKECLRSINRLERQLLEAQQQTLSPPPSG